MEAHGHTSRMQSPTDPADRTGTIGVEAFDAACRLPGVGPSGLGRAPAVEARRNRAAGWLPGFARPGRAGPSEPDADRGPGKAPAALDEADVRARLARMPTSPSRAGGRGERLPHREPVRRRPRRLADVGDDGDRGRRGRRRRPPPGGTPRTSRWRRAGARAPVPPARTYGPGPLPGPPHPSPRPPAVSGPDGFATRARASTGSGSPSTSRAAVASGSPDCRSSSSAFRSSRTASILSCGSRAVLVQHFAPGPRGGAPGAGCARPRRVPFAGTDLAAGVDDAADTADGRRGRLAAGRGHSRLFARVVFRPRIARPVRRDLPPAQCRELGPGILERLDHAIDQRQHAVDPAGCRQGVRKHQHHAGRKSRRRLRGRPRRHGDGPSSALNAYRCISSTLHLARRGRVASPGPAWDHGRSVCVTARRRAEAGPRSPASAVLHGSGFSR